MLMDNIADIDAPYAVGNHPSNIITRYFSILTTQSLEVILKASCPRVSSLERSKEEETKFGKKKYPLNITLPDINNRIHGKNEFRMYTFKVKPCFRAYSHDWNAPLLTQGRMLNAATPRSTTSMSLVQRFERGHTRMVMLMSMAMGYSKASSIQTSTTPTFATRKIKRGGDPNELTKRRRMKLDVCLWAYSSLVIMSS